MNDGKQAPKPVKPVKRNTIFKRIVRNKFAVTGGIIVAVFLLIAVFGPLLSPYDPTDIDLNNTVKPPTPEHIMGTDDKGRDVFSRVLAGTRPTLMIGLFAVFIGASFGIFLGVVSGFYGKKIDTVIMRIVDIMLAFPGIILALAIVGALGPGIRNVTIAVGIFSIPMFARLARSSTLQVKNLEYIDSVRVLGGKDSAIILKYVLPNIISPLIVQATLRLATAILSASALSFLGVGAQPPSPEWGAMLSNAREYIFTAPYLAIFPGLMLCLMTMGFNLLGDGLRDVLDPRMKE